MGKDQSCDYQMYWELEVVWIIRRKFLGRKSNSGQLTNSGYRHAALKISQILKLKFICKSKTHAYNMTFHQYHRTLPVRAFKSSRFSITEILLLDKYNFLSFFRWLRFSITAIWFFCRYSMFKFGTWSKCSNLVIRLSYR